ncbi:MAG: cupin domain-containing protein [Gemmatimonadales bacterium]|nr:MAG: cupin domain-containing protein [Gemmatimonadales bacterium]
MTEDTPEIRHPDPSAEFLTGERCHILETWNETSDPGVSVARARVTPGITTELHVLDGIAERYLVTQGTGEMELDGRSPIPVGPGDFVYIPAGVTQRIINTGADDLIFYCICTPAWREGVYRGLE